MDKQISINYIFEFPGKEVKQFSLLLDKTTLTLNTAVKSVPPDWTRLEHEKCPNCTLDDSAQYCPIAVNLFEIIDEFRDHHAYEKVKVTVTTSNRGFFKETTIQEGLSSLFGVIMVSSGCPVMDLLKPMVRFHLPFSSIDETVYRAVSTYVMAQFLRQRDGKYADWKMGELEKVCFEIGSVNKHFARRLAGVSGKDANINALSSLDGFASLIPMEAEKMLKTVSGYFHAYMK